MKKIIKVYFNRVSILFTLSVIFMLSMAFTDNPYLNVLLLFISLCLFGGACYVMEDLEMSSGERLISIKFHSLIVDDFEK